jgi:hypothetical protein
LARKGGTVIAGGVFCRFATTVHYKFGASDSAYQHLRGNNAVLWSAILRFSREGMVTLDLGKTDYAHAGLRRYKLGWGAREMTLPHTKISLPSGVFCEPVNRTHGWHNQVFRSLPSLAGRMVGRLVYRHLA